MTYDFQSLYKSRSYQKRLKSVTPELYQRKFRPKCITINATLRANLNIFPKVVETKET